MKSLCLTVAALCLAACGGPDVETAPPVDDTTPPSAPAGLTATALSESAIALSWTEGYDLVKLSHHRVYRGGRRIGSPPEASLRDSGLSAQTQYCYRVTAVDTSGNESLPSDEACATTRSPAPRFAGFDFSLEEGDFWAFGWSFYEQSWAQGSSTTTQSDRGMFFVRLGAARVVAGVTLNAVEVYGRAAVRGRYLERSFAPRWRYLALEGGRLLGSRDGTSVEVVFDLQRGTWAGGGFFAQFPANKLVSAAADRLTNPFVSAAAISAKAAASQSQCEYFPGVGSICGDSSFNYLEKDYYQQGVGPLGYRYENTYSDCGGGFCSGATRKYDVGLLGSSFTNHTFAPQHEQEPNDSRAAAGSFEHAGRVLVGTVLSTDAATVTSLSSPQYPDLRLHDFFTVNHGGGAMSAELSFEGHRDADLDLFVYDAAGNLVGHSIGDNPASKDPHERVIKTLPAGRYTVAVSGYLTPSRVTWSFQWN